MYCIYSGKEIEESEASPEHIIPLSLGGCNEFRIQVGEEMNSRLGSEVDGKLANDFFVALDRIKAGTKGHSKKKPSYRVRKSRTEDGRPLNITFEDGQMKVYDPVGKKYVGLEEIEGQVQMELAPIDLNLRLRFLAKTALATGYFLFGQKFVEHADCDGLRAVMLHKNLEDALRAEPEKVKGIRFYDTFTRVKELDKGPMGIYEMFCEALGSSNVMWTYSPESIIVHVGLLGKPLGIINFPADVKQFPADGDFWCGHVLVCQDGVLKRGPWRSAVIQLCEVGNLVDKQILEAAKNWDGERTEDIQAAIEQLGGGRAIEKQVREALESQRGEQDRNGKREEELKMEKIKMTTPLVEMDGDEMTRILWKQIKEELLEPYIDLKTEYYDLGLPERERTGDQVTVDAAEAIKKYGVGVKCATITPNAQRVEEYKLSQMWKSPNGTIRAILDGTVFRAPIMVSGINPVVKNWKEPITIARHAFGDVYRASELRIPGEGKAELIYTSADGSEERRVIHEFQGAGVLQGQFNLDSSISSFARSCFQYALDTRQDLWFSTKDTISKTYDHTFKDIFADIYEAEFKEKFQQEGIAYFYTLIDDAVARVIRSRGGFIWACKNYDGDVMSDMVSTAFGSLAMMTSVLVSPDGNYEYEAAHGTVTQHYYRHLKGEQVSTNPMATIFAWTGALAKRGELDGIPELTEFAQRLEKAAVAAIESGVMTGDLAGLWEGEAPAQKVTGLEFLRAVRERL